jgi:hypothetical protein
MRSVIVLLLLTLRTSFRERAALQLEILALRHQLSYSVKASSTSSRTRSCAVLSTMGRSNA